MWTSTLTLADAVTRVTWREGGVEQLDEGGLDCKDKKRILSIIKINHFIGVPLNFYFYNSTNRYSHTDTVDVWMWFTHIFMGTYISTVTAAVVRNNWCTRYRGFDNNLGLHDNLVRWILCGFLSYGAEGEVRGHTGVHSTSAHCAYWPFRFGRWIWSGKRDSVLRSVQWDDFCWWTNNG